ncbi:hypothetical protein DMENIID0001_122000 [Sergentomyia squamirostris]
MSFGAGMCAYVAPEGVLRIASGGTRTDDPQRTAMYLLSVAEKFFSSAAKEEQEKTSEENDSERGTDVTVSGDGTWKKRGFSSLYGVTTLIGHFSRKVLDIFVSSACCKMCKTWENKLDTSEYEEWHEDHVQKKECCANHAGASGNMETYAVLAMFQRLISKYGLRRNYYSVEAMKMHFGPLMIISVQLTRIQDMKSAQRAKIPGALTRKPWRRKKFKKFKHDYQPLPDDCLSAMKPIYQDLSNDNLLEGCLGGFTQNNNESINQLIWKITPKIVPAGSKIVEIAALVSACTFNEGTAAILFFLQMMGMNLGNQSHEMHERKMTFDCPWPN